MNSFSLDESIGFIIKKTARHLKHELQKAFRDNGHNITPEQWSALCRLWEKEGMTQIELAERVLKDKPTMTRMIDVLVKRGLVVRSADLSDRRTFRIYLTEDGRILKGKLVPLAESVFEKATAGLSDVELKMFKNTLEKVDSNLS